jgi:coenzyme F420-reducing hydrogenase delta subunit
MASGFAEWKEARLQQLTSQIRDTSQALELHEGNLQLSFDILYLTSYIQSASQVERRLIKEGILVAGEKEWNDFEVQIPETNENELLRSERVAFGNLAVKTRTDHLERIKAELEEEQEAIAEQLQVLSKAEEEQWHLIWDLISTRSENALLKKRMERLKQCATKLNAEAARFRANRPLTNSGPGEVDSLQEQIQGLTERSKEMSDAIVKLKSSLDIDCECPIDILKIRLQRETERLKEAAEQCCQALKFK